MTAILNETVEKGHFWKRFETFEHELGMKCYLEIIVNFVRS